MSVFNLDFSSFASSAGSQPVLMLSIHNARERELIQKVLPEGLSIETSTHNLSTGQLFDLCIMDQQSFDKNKERLQDLKEQAAPIFLPFLLLTQNQKVVQKSPEILEFADDIVYIPVSLKLLESRIKMMLKQREYSLKLEDEKQKLRESEKRWEQLVENNPSLVQLTANDNRIKYINPAGAKLYGADDPSEIIGKLFTDFISVESEKHLEKRIDKILQGKRVNPAVYEAVTKDGKQKFVELDNVVMKHDDEQVILTVAKDNTERFEYEQKLKQSLQEKKTLLQEIHHRVKNNLAVVSGMLQLQAFDTENREVKKFLNDSENRIKTMALIHEQLYKSNSLSKIDFGLYVKQLIDNVKEVSENSKEVDLELEQDSFQLNINQAVPCALILNEVISNSYGYPFKEPQGDSIKVLLKEKDGQIFVQVKNSDRSFSKDFHQKSESSMGFTIIETLIKQLESELNIEDKNGLVFSFSFTKQEIRGSASGII